MNRYAIIENSLVVNVAVSDLEFAKLQGWVLISDEVGINWNYIKGVFTPPELPPEPVELTPQEKLANTGLSVDELKVLLGIN
jgi:hypothetical protein